jgi:hypothetical protein
MRVRICRSCRGLWAAWGEVEPYWAWPTTGTRFKTVSEDAFARLELCMCDPNKP